MFSQTDFYLSSGLFFFQCNIAYVVGLLFCSVIEMVWYKYVNWNILYTYIRFMCECIVLTNNAFIFFYGTINEHYPISLCWYSCVLQILCALLKYFSSYDIVLITYLLFRKHFVYLCGPIINLCKCQDVLMLDHLSFYSFPEWFLYHLQKCVFFIFVCWCGKRAELGLPFYHGNAAFKN